MSEVIEICKKLIKTQSYSGQEKEVALLAGELCRECGFDSVEYDKYGNMTAKLYGKNKGKTLIADAHMDTVPVIDADEWSYPPFAADTVDGKIYGRGTSDMKGALASMIYAGKLLSKDRNFSGTYVVAGICHEECFEGVAAREVSKNIKPDYVIIGEASQLRIKCGQRGRCEVKVETFGTSCHSANPEKGVNAVLSMTKLISEIDKLKAPEHEKLGKGILTLTDVKSEPYPGASVVPNYCVATYDRRTLVGETPEDVLAPINAIIEKLSAEDKNFHAKVSIAEGKEKCYTDEIISGRRFFPAWIIDENSETVKKAEAALEKAGIKPEIDYYSFCTNGSHYAGEAGYTTIGFGPSLENLAHTRDEYIETEQLEKAAVGYKEIVESLLA